MPSNRNGARTPGIVAADYESGADREQQNPGGKDEDESRMVMIEEKAKEWRRHRRAGVETRIDEPDHRAHGSGRSRAAHQQVTRRLSCSPRRTLQRRRIGGVLRRAPARSPSVRLTNAAVNSPVATTI